MTGNSRVHRFSDLAARLLMLLAACGASGTIAQAPPSNMLMQYGNRDCAVWFSIQERPLARVWFLGHLSGMNLMNVSNGNADALSALGSAEQASIWLDNYCKANPLSTLTAGSLRLYTELIKKANAK